MWDCCLGWFVDLTKNQQNFSRNLIDLCGMSTRLINDSKEEFVEHDLKIDSKLIFVKKLNSNTPFPGLFQPIRRIVLVHPVFFCLIDRTLCLRAWACNSHMSPRSNM